MHRVLVVSIYIAHFHDMTYVCDVVTRDFESALRDGPAVRVLAALRYSRALRGRPRPQCAAARVRVGGGSFAPALSSNARRGQPRT